MTGGEHVVDEHVLVEPVADGADVSRTDTAGEKIQHREPALQRAGAEVVDDHSSDDACVLQLCGQGPGVALLGAVGAHAREAD